MSTVSTTQTFGFDGDPLQSLDISGLEVGLAPFGFVFGLVVFPFALGFLARRNLAWSSVAFGAVLLTHGSQHALLLNVGGLAPSTIPFPWSYLATWALASIPAAAAGYGAAMWHEKRRGRAVD